MIRAIFADYAVFKEASKELDLDSCVYSNTEGIFHVVTFKMGKDVAFNYSGPIIPPTFNEDFPKAIFCDYVDQV